MINVMWPCSHVRWVDDTSSEPFLGWFRNGNWEKIHQNTTHCPECGMKPRKVCVVIQGEELESMKRAITIAEQLSNVAYNLRQSKDIKEDWRNMLNGLATQWDAVKSKIPQDLRQ